MSSQLIIDLRFEPLAQPEYTGVRQIFLNELVYTSFKPISLIRLLWGRRYDSVSVFTDDLTPSIPQAGGLILAGLARTRNLELHSSSGIHHMGRVAFLVRAFSRLALAVPSELLHSVRVLRRVKRILTTDYDLPSKPARISSVAYIRPEPAIHIKGHFAGGAASHTLGVVTGFLANGLNVYVYAPSQLNGASGAIFTKIPPRRAYHLIHWLMHAESSDVIAAAGLESQVDFVYQRHSLGSYAGLELAQRRNIPLVLEFNSPQISWGIKYVGTGRAPRENMLTALENKNLHCASLIVVVSDLVKEMLIGQGVPSERILVNPNGVDVNKLAPLRNRRAAQWRRHLGRPEVPTVGYSGVFADFHGVRLFPEIIELVDKQHPNVQWILVGAGKLQEEVRDGVETRGLAEKVFMPGMLAHDEALKLLSACDVCISPHVQFEDGTRFFGSPTKVFEYMGLGKAIVASDLEQIGQVLDDERTALLCSPGNTQEVANAIVRLLSDDELRKTLGQSALDKARGNYTWEAHTRRILDALKA